MGEAQQKLIAYCSIIFGIVTTLFLFIFSYSIQPRMAAMSIEMELTNNLLYPTLMLSYLGIVIGVVNTFIGYKILKTNTKNKKNYSYIGLTLNIITILLSGFVVTTAVSSVILPIYSLTSEF